MQTTFALLRQEIVQENPLVGDFLEKWPALRMESQVCAEFHRITNVNLRNQLFSELDRHTLRLIALYRQKAARTGKVSEALREILRICDLQEVQDVHMKRNAALRALPLYLLREEDPQFFKSWSAEEVDRPDITNTPVAIVSVVTEGTPSQVDLSPARTAILVEGDFVIRNIPRMADSFALLFGLMYVLHLDYPKKLINTFTFIQKVLMGLDDGKPLKPCLLNLKNDLLLRE
ncbi:Aconitate hydratase A [Dissostichus eleginoides]|uniref:Aconitate hydratase A n=1 Tax=Dissostichus eleginoides TaxID=100907 RepID=A0AAD9CNT9_DISEL|nr:Aconitate hydratase A [Dissostichus eleginoides]